MGSTPRRRGRARVHRPARAPARARQRRRRDRRVGSRGRRAWRFHDRLRDAQHDAGPRRARGAGGHPRRGRGVRIAGRAAGARCGVGRPDGGDPGRPGRAGRRGRCRVLRRRRADPIRGDPPKCARVRGLARHTDRRPPRGPDADRRGRGERRVRRDRARPARLALLGRGRRRSGATSRSSRMCTATCRALDST